MKKKQHFYVIGWLKEEKAEWISLKSFTRKVANKEIPPSYVTQRYLLISCEIQHFEALTKTNFFFFFSAASSLYWLFSKCLQIVDSWDSLAEEGECIQKPPIRARPSKTEQPSAN